jgi:putative ABC transport system substrate-binding protein
MSRLSRRQLVVGAGSLGLLAGCGRLPWQPQPPARVRRIGYLSASSAASVAGHVDSFRQGLADHGYVEGQNLIIDWRFADGEEQRLPALAAELVALQPELVVGHSPLEARALREVSTTLPFVGAGLGSDLVAAGLAASLARPGSNVTGMTNPTALLDGKRLQLLADAVPGVSRLGILLTAPAPQFSRDEHESFLRSRGVHLQTVEVSRGDEMDGAFQAIANERVEALYVRGSFLTTTHRSRILTLAAEHRLPAMYGSAVFAHEGGLLAYQSSAVGAHRRAAYYVDKILKGAKPAELPIEEPHEFDFVINLGTARALGLTIPEPVLVRATEVIP